MAETKKTTKTTQKSVAKPLNIYQKLNKLRSDFLAKGINKTGKNMYAEFKYFELEDIVPVALPILDSYDTSFVITIESELAIGNLINNENPEDKILFTIPRVSLAEPGKNKMNEIQAVGSETTYYRRYLYMLMLDIIDADSTDNQNPQPPVDKTPKTAKKPKTDKKPKVDKVDKKEEKSASKLQITTLKNVLNDWVEKDPDAKDKVTSIIKKTNKFASVTATQAEELIQEVGKMLKEYE